MLISQLKPGNKYPTVLWSLPVTAVTGNINEREMIWEKLGPSWTPTNSHTTHTSPGHSALVKKTRWVCCYPRNVWNWPHLFLKLQTLKVLEKYFFWIIKLCCMFVKYKMLHFKTVYISRTKFEDFPLNRLFFPGGSDCKESDCKAGDLGFSLWVGKIPLRRECNPLQYSYLENSMHIGAWWATVHGVKKSQTRLSDKHFHFH